MPLETQRATLALSDDSEPEPRSEAAEDRIQQTAEDRPSPSQMSLPALSDPTADHLDPDLAARRDDVEQKHERVRRFLAENGFDALVLGRDDSVAWFTAGGETSQTLSGEASALWLYINQQSRAVVCDNVQSARVFEEEIAGLGFQLKERPWHDDPSQVIAQLGRRKTMAADMALPGVKPLPEQVQALRFPLTRLDRRRLRGLGRTLTLSIEATCRNFQPGETEADIAGHLAHRFIREGVVPVDLRVAGDDRPARFREPRFKAAQIEKRALISAVGRRQGLCASATRIVTFGEPDRNFQKAQGLAAMVDASCIFFSRPGELVSEVFRRARRLFEKFGHPDEWMLDYQGFLIGYQAREALLRPDSTIQLAQGHALCWSPSVGSARSEDTIIIDDRGFENVTEAQNWPQVEVAVKGYSIARPGILIR